MPIPFLILNQDYEQYRDEFKAAQTANGRLLCATWAAKQFGPIAGGF
jgi:hypothetical protein